MTETQLVGRITLAIQREYPAVWILKTHGGPFQRSGIPDLLVCIDGRLFGFEVKELKAGESEKHAYDRTTLLQQAELSKIKSAGGVAATVLSPRDELDVIESATLSSS